MCIVNSTETLQKIKQVQKAHELDIFGEDVTLLKAHAEENKIKDSLMTSFDSMQLENLEIPAFPVAKPQFTETKPEKKFTLSKKKRNTYDRNLMVYNNKLSKFNRNLKEWEQQNEKWPDTYQKMKKLQQIGQQLPDVDATPEAMLQSLYNNEGGFSLHHLTRYHTEETAVWSKLAEMHGFKGVTQTVRSYLSSQYVAMNDYLRKKDLLPANHEQSTLEKETDQAAEAMKLNSFSHDIVVRRCTAMDALSGMIGQQVSDTESVLEQAVANHTILTEKGFCSTTLSASGPIKNDIEMVILAHKGTNALWVHNSSGLDSRGEKEILLAPGTKFKIIKAQKNENSGTPKWRLYLETIPQNSEGVPNA